MCVVGLITTLLVWALPNRFKPYHIRYGWDDWKIMVERKSWEYGFGPSGLIHAHLARAWQSRNPRLLDPMRRDWKIAKAHPPAPMPVNTDLLQWDEWGPNVTTTQTGVNTFEDGAVYTLPYSIIAIGFAIPLMWWMAWRMLILCCPRQKNPNDQVAKSQSSSKSQ